MISKYLQKVSQKLAYDRNWNGEVTRVEGRILTLQKDAPMNKAKVAKIASEPTTSEIRSLISKLESSFEDLFIAEDVSDKCNGILITYIQRDEHIDPNFNLLVYGEQGIREAVIKNILDKHKEEPTFVFFCTTIGDKRYITAYYKIAKVLYKGTDDDEINNLPDCSAKAHDNLIIIGDREGSKILTFPLLLDKKLALSLYSLKFTSVEFQNQGSELSVISNKIRQHREMSEADTKILLEKCRNRG